MIRFPSSPKATRARLAACVVLGGGMLLVSPVAPRGQSVTGPTRVTAITRDAARDWERRIDRLASDGTLRLARTRPDTLLEGRTHERFDQYHGGVRVSGAQLVRQLDADGRAVSVFGSLHEAIGIETDAALPEAQAGSRAAALTGGELLPGRAPELLILPRNEGGYVLAWSVQVATRADVLTISLDADTGAEIARQSLLKRDTAVGAGRGVLGDEKKLSVNRVGGAYFADDQHRPPSLVTLDMRGSLTRTIRLLDGFINAAQSDIASDTDNTWTDAPTVDAHVHLGWTYDYYFKRFGRRGLDNNDRRISAIVHPVSRANIDEYFNDDEVLGTFYANAFWCGGCNGGMIMFGEGLPPGLFNVDVDYLSGALDIVAHELTHGVNEYSSGLIYRNESGALDEGFADIMGISAEFFFQPAGSGRGRAEYMMGEDVFPISPGWARSASDPRSLGNPDHYSARFIGADDNGGVHVNSTIASHAFYLAIEGGTNRTSGRSVQGVGAGNREQVERVFYRGFTFLLPPDATFSVARQATLQAAADLYGTSSPAYRAVSEAWDAVGVF